MFELEKPIPMCYSALGSRRGAFILVGSYGLKRLPSCKLPQKKFSDFKKRLDIVSKLVLNIK